MTAPVLVAFAGAESLARSLTAALRAESRVLQWRHFPDGESLVALEGDYAERDVLIVATLRDADPMALPLLFAARTARELGAASVGIVAPYLAYMRQDARFRPGQAISSVHFAAYLSWTFDWLVTVDPHLHRHAQLGPLFSIPATKVTAIPQLGDWIGENVDAPVLIGPDAESAQWVEPLAERIGAPVVVLEKLRRGDRDVSVSAPSRAVLEGRTPVLVDDIVSSGQTMLETLAHLRALALPKAICVAVHGVFADGADRRLVDAGAARVVTTNTIAHATNAIDVAPALVPAIERALARARDEQE